MPERFRQLIRNTMDEMGVSQSDLARMTGIGQPHISKYLRGETSLTDTSLCKILDALGIDIDRLKD